MNKYKSILSYLFFLAIGIVCIYFSFKNQDIHKLYTTIFSINYLWFIPVLICTIICHIARTKRWQLLLDQQEYKSNTLVTFNAIMSSYLVNFATGKLGEIYRCAVMNRKSNIPFSYALATVFLERVIDVLSLLILLTFTILFYHDIVINFYQKYLSNLSSYLNSYTVIFLVCSLILVLIFFIYYKNKIVHFFENRFLGFYRGILSIYLMKDKYMFIFYTIIIWLMYLLMTYFWFFAFNDPRLTIQTALLVIVIGGIGRSLPVPAHGLGTYHLCASFALLAMLVNELESTTIPIVIHAGQSVFYLIFGTLSMVLINLPENVFKMGSK